MRSAEQFPNIFQSQCESNVCHDVSDVSAAKFHHFSRNKTKKTTPRLANFKHQVTEKFGTAENFFQALDTQKMGKVREKDFIQR